MNRCFSPAFRRLAARFACLLAASLSALSLTAATGPQTVIVNDTFTDNERVTQNPPGTLQWFASGGTSTLAASGGTLILTLTGGRHAAAYFPETTIAIGESIELAFDFKTTAEFANQAGGLRFALLHSNGNTKVTADNSNLTVTYIGYGVTTNAAPTATNPTVLRERTSTTASQLITSTGSYIALTGGSGGPIATFTAGPVYRATLRVERLDTDLVRVTTTYSGGSLPAYEVTTTDVAGAVTAFDTIALAIGSANSVAAVTEITFDNVAVTHYGVPPPTPPEITSQPAATTARAGDPAVFSVTATGSSPLTYQWYRDGQLLTAPSSATLNLASVQAADAGSYTVKVSNAAGEVTSDPAVLTVDTTPVAPSITAPPFSQTVVAGDSASFVVRATGSAPFTYQWLRNGVAVPDATSATLTLSNVTLAQAGSYSVAVTNAAGTTLSSVATLTVVAAAPTSTTLLNDTFSGANFITQSLPTSAHWYSSSTSSTGNLALQSGALLVPAGRHALAYFTESGARTLEIGDELRVTFTLNFSTVGNSSGGLRFGLFNSNGATRATDGDNASFTNYDGFIATTTGTFPDTDARLVGSMNFMRRVNPSSTGALLSTVGNYTTVDDFPGNSQSFATGVNYTFSVSAVRTAAGKIRFTFHAVGGTLPAYGFEIETDSALTGFDSFAVLSTSASGSTFTLDNFVVTHTAAPAAVAPTILAQPQSASVSPGESVTFSVDATGTPVPTFQWRKGGVAIDGATGASYTIASAAAGDAGDYDVVVTNSAGSATSNVAVLTVASPFSALQTWRVTHFGAPEATGNAADLADPDADGLVNLVEYALGFDPNEVDVAALPATASAEGQWVFNYTRPVDRSDLTYTVQVSTNLQSWTTVAQEQAGVVGDTATWRAVYPQAGNPNAFFRLSVSLNAP